ncbi:hypothetical protein Tco_0547493 [Tanacetum coccineum]
MITDLVNLDIAPLPAADQRHPWLRYQIQEYTKGIRHSYEQRLETMWSRLVNRVHVLDFEGLTPEMSTYRMSDTEMGLDVADTMCFQLGGALKKVAGVDLFYLRSMDCGTTNVPHLLAQYLFRHAGGGRAGPRCQGGLYWASGYAFWASQGPKRQQATAAGAYEADEAGQAAKEFAQEISTPAYALPPPPLAP